MSFFFSKEEWPIATDREGPREYAGMSNICRVDTLSGRRWFVNIQVPASLFQFMETVLKVPHDAMGGANAPTLYLVELDKSTWAFGIDFAGAFHDLWAYKKLPVWAKCT